MMMLMLFVLFTMLFSNIIMLIAFFISKKNYLDEEKLSPFEAGFTPRMNSRMAFSSQFFLIALIFIIFDIELILLFPYLSNFTSFNLTFMNLIWILLLLTFGFLWEWSQKMLEWYK